MHRRTRTSKALRHALGAAAWLACAWAVQAQTATSQTGATDLHQAFEAAWARQPEALALQARRDAAEAQRRAAGQWTPDAPTFEALAKTDRVTRNDGVREYEAGIALPLWLPGERGRSGALADAQATALESRHRASQLRIAAVVRDAWWLQQRARIEADIARGQLDNARRIAADSARRLKAGDLARADQHQADGAVAAAESSMAQAQAALAGAVQQLIGLTGLRAIDGTSAAPEATPSPEVALPEAHVAVAELRDRAAAADRAAELAATQRRANPELTVSTTRERGAFGESYGQSVTVGIRVPFGGGPRADAKIAAARADAAEAQASLALERQRLTTERESARLRVEAARTQLAAAERRAVLARESRGFFDKAFNLGETDLPTRLRIEAEAVEAERQAARSRIDLAAAISGWRQVLGLLPE